MLKYFQKSKLLQPLIKALSLKQFLWLVILFNLLPCIADNSLFSFDGISYLNWLNVEKSDLASLKKFLPAAALGIGCLTLLYLRQYYWIPALVPSMLITFGQFQPYLVLEHSREFALVLSIACKLSLIIYCIKGRIRTPAFLIFMVTLTFLVSFKQIVLFLLLISVLRFISLVVLQNYQVFKKIRFTKLSLLILKSLLLWSPILALTIPQQTISNNLKQSAKDLIYEETFVERQYIFESISFDELLTYSVQDTLDRYKDQLKLTKSTGDNPKRQKALTNSLIYVKNHSDSGRYENFRELLADFQYNYELRISSYLKRPPNRIDLFVERHVLFYLEKIAVRNELIGRTALEMDIELSIYKNLLAKNDEINASTDKYNVQLDQQIEAKTIEVDKVFNQFKDELQSVKDEASSRTQKQAAAYKKRLKAKCVALEKQAYQRLDAVHYKFDSLINLTPTVLSRTYVAVFPEYLTQVSSKFMNNDCSGIALKCRTGNFIKGELRDAYKEARSRGLENTAEAGKRIASKAKNKLNHLIDSLKSEVSASISKIQAEADSAITSAEGDIENGLNDVHQAVLKNTEIQRTQVKETFAEVSRSVAEVNDSIKVYLKQTTESINQASKGIIIAFQSTSRAVDLFGDLAMLFIIINSFLYVFSRVAFSTKTDLFVSLTSDDEPMIENGYKLCGSEFKIPYDIGHEFYLSRRFEPTGIAPKLVIPQWHISVPKRILNKAYFMNQVKYKSSSDEQVTFRSVAGAEFIEFNLSEGQELVFHYRDLVLFSQGITLSSQISARITSALLGKLFFTVARGPGKVVLLSKGSPIITAGDDQLKSISVDRILSWDKHANYSVSSQLNLIDLYFSGLYLKRESDHPVVVDTDDSKYSKKVGLLRFVRKFLFP